MRLILKLGEAYLMDFAARLRRATMAEHREAETRTFISRLMGGEVPLAGFAALTAQYLIIYRELEGAAERMRADGTAAAFADPALDVLSRDVGQPGDGWQAAGCGVGPVVIVVMQEGR